MSSLGYVIVFMACAPTGECAPASMLMTRYDAVDQCRSALPTAQARLDRIGRAGMLAPVCSNLDSLCKPLAAGSARPGSPLRLTAGPPGGAPQGPLDAHLAIMCHAERDAPPGCDG